MSKVSPDKVSITYVPFQYESGLKERWQQTMHASYATFLPNIKYLSCSATKTQFISSGFWQFSGPNSLTAAVDLGRIVYGYSNSENNNISNFPVHDTGVVIDNRVGELERSDRLNNLARMAFIASSSIRVSPEEAAQGTEMIYFGVNTLLERLGSPIQLPEPQL